MPVTFKPKSPSKLKQTTETELTALHALSMHINLTKDDNIGLLLHKLAHAERIENTFDIADVSEAISMLDWQTASTDFTAKPELQ